MCGLSAIFSYKGSIRPSLIHKMNETIRHRGPDDEGYLFFREGNYAPCAFGGGDTPEEVYSLQFGCKRKKQMPEDSEEGFAAALGHRRLAIIDLSAAGHQPMGSQNHRYWIVHNGEVYNYRELREQLEEKEYHFHSATDTEVILKAYKEWGKDCLPRLNGMFSFLIVDRKERTVFAARDRFGIKPLYYWVSPEGFLAFASEIKQFTNLPGWKAQVNPQRVYDFLQWGIVDHTKETLFSSVYQLRGGECATYSLGEDPSTHLKVEQWYTLSTTPYHGSFEQASSRFYELMEESVQLRLRADVEVGSCLSGDLDTSSIVCITNHLLRQEGNHSLQKTFSARSEERLYDESSFIDMVADHTKLEQHFVQPSLDSLFEIAKEAVWYQDEPFDSTNVYDQWLVFSLGKQNQIKVMLDGQGADEALGGYQSFFSYRLYDLFRSLQWGQGWKEMREMAEQYPGLFPAQGMLQLLCPRFLSRFGKGVDRVENWLDVKGLGIKDRDPRTRSSRLFNAQCHHQLTESQLPKLLHFEDRNSMAHSVESRTPFLDYRLVEFLYSLPSEYKMRGSTSKRVLREGLNGVLPELVRNQTDKLRFTVSEEEWVKAAPKQFQQAVVESIEHSNGILKPGLKKVTDEMIFGERPFSPFLWRAISFGHWMEKFLN